MQIGGKTRAVHVLRALGMCFEGQHTHNLNFCGLFRIAI